MALRWNWGTRIALVYTTFALGTLGMVALAVSQKTDLVAADYYEQALATDDRIAATRRALALGTAFSVHHDREAQRLTITWPHRPDDGGVIVLYRASDASADEVVTVAVHESLTQQIPLRDKAPGAWRLRVSWQHDAAEYFAERVLTIPGVSR